MTYSECRSVLIELIEKSSCETPLVIAIDGRSASGKTTFANEVARSANIPVIHTDDFCRPRDKEGNLNLSEFDGNFDIERFKKQVVKGLKSKNDFEIGIFNCQKGCIDGYANIPKSSCYIIEGAYSLNPNLGEYATLKIFFDTSKEIQIERILKRNGEKALAKFLSVWIPAEERYISHYKISEKCNYYINN